MRRHPDIDELKHDIENNRYEVDSRELAEVMLRDIALLRRMRLALGYRATRKGGNERKVASHRGRG